MRQSGSKSRSRSGTRATATYVLSSPTRCCRRAARAPCARRARRASAPPRWPAPAGRGSGRARRPSVRPGAAAVRLRCSSRGRAAAPVSAPLTTVPRPCRRSLPSSSNSRRACHGLAGHLVLLGEIALGGQEPPFAQLLDQHGDVRLDRVVLRDGGGAPDAGAASGRWAIVVEVVHGAWSQTRYGRCAGGRAQRRRNRDQREAASSTPPAASRTTPTTRAASGVVRSWPARPRTRTPRPPLTRTRPVPFPRRHRRCHRRHDRRPPPPPLPSPVPVGLPLGLPVPVPVPVTLSVLLPVLLPVPVPLASGAALVPPPPPAVPSAIATVPSTPVAPAVPSAPSALGFHDVAVARLALVVDPEAVRVRLPHPVPVVVVALHHGRVGDDVVRHGGVGGHGEPDLHGERAAGSHPRTPGTRRRTPRFSSWSLFSNSTDACAPPQ